METLWFVMNFLTMIVVLYFGLLLCCLSARLALSKDDSYPVAGGTIAAVTLLATVHIFSYQGFWATAFEKTLNGPSWCLFSVCKFSHFAVVYAVVLITASMVCFLLNCFSFKREAMLIKPEG